LGGGEIVQRTDLIFVGASETGFRKHDKPDCRQASLL
jgi:hypothetical protein